MLRLKVSTLHQGAADEKDTPIGWKVYGWCEENDANTLSVIRRLTDFDQKDALAVVDGLIKLLQRAPAGQPLERTYDRKQCHEAFEFKHNGKTHKVWRIWPGGVVRIYFFYGNDKKIVIAWALAKRKGEFRNEVQF